MERGSSYRRDIASRKSPGFISTPRVVIIRPHGGARRTERRGETRTHPIRKQLTSRLTRTELEADSHLVSDRCPAAFVCTGPLRIAFNTGRIFPSFNTVMEGTILNGAPHQEVHLHWKLSAEYVQERTTKRVTRAHYRVSYKTGANLNEQLPNNDTSRLLSSACSLISKGKFHKGKAQSGGGEGVSSATSAPSVPQLLQQAASRHRK